MRLSEAQNVLLGNTQVSSLYLGGTNIWSNTHPVVTGWLNRLSTNGIAQPDAAKIKAMSDFMRALDAFNLTPNVKRLNLFIAGTDWRAAFFPLVYGLGTSAWDLNGASGSTLASLSSGPFQSQDYSLIGGFDPSRVNSAIVGTTKTAAGAYLDTTVSSGVSGFTGGLNIHLACHVNSLGVKSGTADLLTEMGYFNSSTSNAILLRANYKSYFNNTRGTPAFLIGPASYNSANPGACLYTAAATPSDPRGFFVGTRTADSTTMTTTLSRSNVLPAPYSTGGYANPNTVAKAGYVFDLSTITLFSDGVTNRAQNVNYSDRKITMYSIGWGLSASDIKNFNAAVAAFNTSIGRTNY